MITVNNDTDVCQLQITSTFLSIGMSVLMSAWALLNHAAADDYDVSLEVRCRRSRWIAGLVTPACGRSNHWLSELM